MHRKSTQSSARAFQAAVAMLTSSRRRSHLRSRPRARSTATGLSCTEQQIFMVAEREGRSSTGSVPADLALVRRLASDEYDTFADVAGRSFGVAPATVSSVYTAEVLANPQIGAYVAETRSGTPVAAGVGILNDGHLGIANVGTIPSFRRQGYARVLTETILRRGALAGAHTAYLHAGPETVPFFERLGFTTRADWTMLEAS
ncbi:GNAT family N-acetyltransferase [Paractinoplanes lichenicola]|uniref:GNAT family N-acetyltransferase n=1 Tax=Paractinoplanes lichenicola TaxID=2802976 RepID=A0ABS1VWQ0_9ACTN|nr:GNAT family N-acetyltransferase [Actinoplanes lichenicola]MBL7258899.1 GNAT family N-acetyltransferase [Actinoplanes lichenicola]